MWTLGAVGAKFIAAAAAIKAGDAAGLEKGAMLIQTTAQNAIGTYAFGWPKLGPSAIARHGDTPLLESGALKGSIEHTVSGTRADIGTNDHKAAWQELGTSRIPPRSFMREAAVRKEQEVVEIIGRDVIVKLMP